MQHGGTRKIPQGRDLTRLSHVYELTASGHLVIKRSIIVLKGAAVFALIALVLAVLGFGGLAGFAWDLAKILFWLALIIAVALAVLGFTIYKKIT